jgi:hypothetical protein
MAKITRIDVNVQTGDDAGADTNGNVYLGFGGREFYLDTSADNWKRGGVDHFVLAHTGANILNAQVNDPTNPPIFEEDVDRFPAYVRFQPRDGNDRWGLTRAVVTFNNKVLPQYQVGAVTTHVYLWLGTKSGLYAYLRGDDTAGH